MTIKKYLQALGVITLFGTLLFTFVLYFLGTVNYCSSYPDSLSDFERIMQIGKTREECLKENPIEEYIPLSVFISFTLAVLLCGERVTSKKIYKPIYKGKKIIHYEEDYQITRSRIYD